VRCGSLKHGHHERMTKPAGCRRLGGRFPFDGDNLSCLIVWRVYQEGPLKGPAARRPRG
jgi:hypothetical protein